ncbi:MAG: aminotransferase class I/II-fold pyridoxal phosphate-dependent enzyme, partial [Burkholderiaceae bacterium]|nr:aminotransferase class I/II-fold pyridoxal phosphate-dependent enzyme [Burkholderiaceae bacterium]
LIASPSNPTGTSISPDALVGVLKAVRTRGGFVMMDEIYLGLSYDAKPQSALSVDNDLIVINSFSKYFHMTGWRLGWLIVPDDMASTVEKMAGSLAICAPTLSQHAALACFTPEAMQIFEQRKRAFQKRRDYLLPEFERLGLHVPVQPDGAFYIYADVSKTGMDSAKFSKCLLEQANIAAVPGLDFGLTHGTQMVRFSYATSLDRLHEAVDRMSRWLRA